MSSNRQPQRPELWDGHTAERIVEALIEKSKGGAATLWCTHQWRIGDARWNEQISLLQSIIASNFNQLPYSTKALFFASWCGLPPNYPISGILLRTTNQAFYEWNRQLSSLHLFIEHKAHLISADVCVYHRLLLGRKPLMRPAFLPFHIFDPFGTISN